MFLWFMLVCLYFYLYEMVGLPVLYPLRVSNRSNPAVLDHNFDVVLENALCLFTLIFFYFAISGLLTISCLVYLEECHVRYLVCCLMLLWLFYATSFIDVGWQTFLLF